MKEKEKNKLIAEHALLVAKFSKGDDSVGARLKKIEEILEMTPTEIASLAIEKYKETYKK